MMMSELTVLLVGGLVLAIGTYAMRAGGGAIVDLLEPYPRLQLAVEDAAVLILGTVMATSEITDGQSFAGWARPAGVALSRLFVCRGVPLPFVCLVLAGGDACVDALRCSR